MAAESVKASEPFMWGQRVPGYPNSYQSMRYEGIWYQEGDCALFRTERDRLPYIGKLYRLFEEKGERKIRVRWFFRPVEIPRFCLKAPLESMDPKEVFIGLGNVIGVENVNVVETILRKVIVLCTARHSGNPQPSARHLDIADYFFNRAYEAPCTRLINIAKIANKPSLVKSFVNKRGDICKDSMFT